MANDTAITYLAGADLSAKQFYAVKDNGSGAAVAIAADTDAPIGILQNKPAAAGAICELANGVGGFGGSAQVVKAIAGGAIKKGDFLGPDGTGKLVKRTIGTDTTKYVCARAGSDAADGDILPVIVIPVPFRAA